MGCIKCENVDFNLSMYLLSIINTTINDINACVVPEKLHTYMSPVFSSVMTAGNKLHEIPNCVYLFPASGLVFLLCLAIFGHQQKAGSGTDLISFLLFFTHSHNKIFCLCDLTQPPVSGSWSLSQQLWCRGTLCHQCDAWLTQKDRQKEAFCNNSNLSSFINTNLSF